MDLGETYMGIHADRTELLARQIGNAASARVMAEYEGIFDQEAEALIYRIVNTAAYYAVEQLRVHMKYEVAIIQNATADRVMQKMLEPIRLQKKFP